jgi:hypothetical protein
MNNTPSSSSLNSPRYPRWLYGVSVLWGTLMGILLYASARFPMWYFYNLGPSSDERGPFWDPGVLMIMPMTGIISAVYFWLILRKPSKRLTLKWIYCLATLLMTVLILTLLVAWWYFDVSDSLWVPEAIDTVIVWLAYGVPALTCMIPSGLLSGIIFQAIAKPRI